MAKDLAIHVFLFLLVEAAQTTVRSLPEWTASISTFGYE
jgi:hypothetical protein